MSDNKQPIAVKKGLSKLARAKFGPGMLLQHDDLEAMTAYTRELSRLLFRSFFGCGVVCGLVPRVDSPCERVTVTIDPGLALDGCGDPIHVPEPVSLLVDDKCDPDIPADLWVVLCGTTKCCSPRASMCSADDDEATSTCTRERDGYEIRLVAEWPDCACGCPPKAKDPKQPKSLEPLDLEQDTAVPQPADMQHAATAGPGNRPGVSATDCQCADPGNACYADHYAGKCTKCCCADGECEGDCACNCVVLGRLHRFRRGDMIEWCAITAGRRVIRPVLMRDMQPVADVKSCKEKLEKSGFTPTTKPGTTRMPRGPVKKHPASPGP